MDGEQNGADRVGLGDIQDNLKDGTLTEHQQIDLFDSVASTDVSIISETQFVSVSGTKTEAPSPSGDVDSWLIFDEMTQKNQATDSRLSNTAWNANDISFLLPDFENEVLKTEQGTSSDGKAFMDSLFSEAMTNGKTNETEGLPAQNNAARPNSPPVDLIGRKETFDSKFTFDNLIPVQDPNHFEMPGPSGIDNSNNITDNLTNLFEMQIGLPREDGQHDDEDGTISWANIKEESKDKPLMQKSQDAVDQDMFFIHANAVDPEGQPTAASFEAEFAVLDSSSVADFHALRVQANEADGQTADDVILSNVTQPSRHQSECLVVQSRGETSQWNILQDFGNELHVHGGLPALSDLKSADSVAYESSASTDNNDLIQTNISALQELSAASGVSEPHQADDQTDSWDTIASKDISPSTFTKFKADIFSDVLSSNESQSTPNRGTQRHEHEVDNENAAASETVFAFSSSATFNETEMEGALVPNDGQNVATKENIESALCENSAINIALFTSINNDEQFTNKIDLSSNMLHDVSSVQTVQSLTKDKAGNLIVEASSAVTGPDKDQEARVLHDRATAASQDELLSDVTWTSENTAGEVASNTSPIDHDNAATPSDSFDVFQTEPLPMSAQQNVEAFPGAELDQDLNFIPDSLNKSDRNSSAFVGSNTEVNGALRVSDEVNLNSELALITNSFQDQIHEDLENGCDSVSDLKSEASLFDDGTLLGPSSHIVSTEAIAPATSTSDVEMLDPMWSLDPVTPAQGVMGSDGLKEQDTHQQDLVKETSAYLNESVNTSMKMLDSPNEKQDASSSHTLATNTLLQETSSEARTDTDDTTGDHDSEQQLQTADTTIVASSNNAKQPQAADLHLTQEQLQPYLNFSREDMIRMIIEQKKLLEKKDSHIADLEGYIDNLVLKVIDVQPRILLSASELAGEKNVARKKPQRSATPGSPSLQQPPPAKVDAESVEGNSPTKERVSITFSAPHLSGAKTFAHSGFKPFQVAFQSVRK